MSLAKEDIKEIENLIIKMLSARSVGANDDIRFEVEIREESFSLKRN